MEILNRVLLYIYQLVQWGAFVVGVPFLGYRLWRASASFCRWLDRKAAQAAIDAESMRCALAAAHERHKSRTAK